ncbi:MAG: caspase family protein, partial [Candidatus Nanopelagicales bacterium]
HGGQMPDTGGDEADKQDETWVLYDRQVLDDELFQRWGKFAEGVRIVVLSDSCHSGSVVRAQLAGLGGTAAGPALRDVYAGGRFMPADANERDNKSRKAVYDKVREATPGESEVPLKARVLLLSGCQDNQTSSDGDRNGLFTAMLREVYKDGYRGGYRRFLSSIKRKLPPWQSPNYLALNDPQRAFNRERPFEI